MGLLSVQTSGILNNNEAAQYQQPIVRQLWALWLWDHDHDHHEKPVDDDNNDDLKMTHLENKDADALKRVEDGEGIGKKETE